MVDAVKLRAWSTRFSLAAVNAALVSKMDGWADAHKFAMPHSGDLSLRKMHAVRWAQLWDRFMPEHAMFGSNKPLICAFVPPAAAAAAR